MVLALAGDSTITRCLAMAARSVAPGSLRPVTPSLVGRPRSRPVRAPSPPFAAAGRVSPRCRGPAAGSPRRSRCRCRCRPRRWRRSDRRARSGAATPSGLRAPRRHPRRRAGPLRRDFDGAGAAPFGISRNRITWYGKKNVDSIWSMKMGRLPSIIRRFVHSRPASSADGSSNRSTSSGCSFAAWMTTFRIMPRCSRTPVSAVTARWSPARWSSRRPSAAAPGPSIRGGRSR